uniref:glutamine synthetase n=1 Tax=Heterorhabditis bacteriophora TaxID=37862 RepID=A0A1I7XFU8_HETBA
MNTVNFILLALCIIASTQAYYTYYYYPNTYSYNSGSYYYPYYTNNNGYYYDTGSNYYYPNYYSNGCSNCGSSYFPYTYYYYTYGKKSCSATYRDVLVSPAAVGHVMFDTLRNIMFTFRVALRVGSSLSKSGLRNFSSNFNVALPLGTPVVSQSLDITIPDTKVLATYVWIDGTGENLREKTRTLEKDPGEPEIQMLCTYGVVFCVDVYFYYMYYPIATYPDPFLGGKHKLVLCETLDAEFRPTSTNHRSACSKVMNKIKNMNPWFGMEQEYLLLDRDGYPLGWPKHGYPAPQGPYYCGVGASKVFGREVVIAHYRACLHAGLAIFGINAEVTPGQWEFQLGCCTGIAMGDELWMARYLLHRVAEQFGVSVTFHPKPSVTLGDWNGAGCHCNFSTDEMRADGGLKTIEAAMLKLEATHKECIRMYDPHNGEDNKHRLTGRHETSSAEEFSWGIANRAASVRIPRGVAKAGKVSLFFQKYTQFYLLIRRVFAKVFYFIF